MAPTVKPAKREKAPKDRHLALPWFQLSEVVPALYVTSVSFTAPTLHNLQIVSRRLPTPSPCIDGFLGRVNDPCVLGNKALHDVPQGRNKKKKPPAEPDVFQQS
jgi:hypothetical protein